jgi:hypothetical protein
MQGIQQLAGSIFNAGYSSEQDRKYLQCRVQYRTGSIFKAGDSGEQEVSSMQGKAVSRKYLYYRVPQ